MHRHTFQTEPGSDVCVNLHFEGVKTLVLCERIIKVHVLQIHLHKKYKSVTSENMDLL